MKRSLLALLLCAVPARGQSVRLPAEVRTEPGQIAVVRADTDCAGLRWLVLDPGLSLIPPDLLLDSRVALALAGKPGRFRVLAYGARGDKASEPALCVVVVGEAPPPGPGPAPDPLTQALQAAYDRETAPEKASVRAQLAALYRQAAEVPGRPEVTTWGQLFETLAAAARTLGVSGKLPLVQAALGTELSRVLPTSRSATLDAAGRTLAADTFRRVALALEGVR